MSRRLVVLLATGIWSHMGLFCAARPTVRELRTPEEYEKLLEHHKTKTGLPVVVDFYSDSCGPCRMIAPIYKRLAEEYKDRAVFAKVNMQTNPVGQRLRVQSMPTFHFYVNGKRSKEFSGAGEQQLRQFTQQVVADAERANVLMTLESLEAFYREADPAKAAPDVAKIHAKCVSLANAGKDCAGGAARELAKKLKAKFGAAPELTSRFAKDAQAGAASAKKPEPAKPSAASSSSRGSSKPLSSYSTDDLLAELEKRAEADDELAYALVEAANEYKASLEAEEEDEDDFGDEEEEGLPEYRPAKSATYTERVVIVGGGPAGLAAAVYAARAGLAPIIVAPPGGGQLLGKGVTIENYPGVEGETGPGLVVKMQKHAADCGAVFYPYKVDAVDLTSGSPFKLQTSSGENITAHALIVSTGADSRWLGAAGEEDFKGAGVSSCATCDGFVFRDRPVAVIGGGDTAMEDALVLARTSSHVTVIHRRDTFRASKALADRVLSHPKITVQWNATVKKFAGAVVVEPDDEDDEDDEDDDEDMPDPTPVLTHLDLEDTYTGALLKLDVAGAFVAIGHDPNTKLFAGQLDRYESGYLKLRGSKFETELSVPGVFAAGDVADSVYRQAITSAGSGAAAALDAERWLSEMGIGDDSADADVMADLLNSFAQDAGEDVVNPYDDQADVLANAKSEL